MYLTPCCQETPTNDDEVEELGEGTGVRRFGTFHRLRANSM